MSFREALENMRAGMTCFDVTVTKTYRLMAHSKEDALQTVQFHEDRVLCGLLESESITVTDSPPTTRASE